jgi:hypothetical protein
MAAGRLQARRHGAARLDAAGRHDENRSIHEDTTMKLTAHAIPERFAKAIPRGFRLVRKQGHTFLLVESVFCPNGHNLVVDSVRIHDESSIKLKVAVNDEPGFVFVDAFWGSHAKLFSFIPRTTAKAPVYVDAFCPYCDAPLGERAACPQKGCRSVRSVRLTLPGGKNTIHVCARLGCPGHVLDIAEMPDAVVRSVSVINFFGESGDDVFGGV